MSPKRSKRIKKLQTRRQRETGETVKETSGMCETGKVKKVAWLRQKYVMMMMMMMMMMMTMTMTMTMWMMMVLI
jgi:hypothetical protein